MPIMPSPMMGRNYPGYTSIYTGLAEEWDKLPKEKKEKYPQEQFLSDAFMDMFGTENDTWGIESELDRSRYAPIGPESGRYSDASGEPMPSYRSPFGEGWFGKGVHEIGMSGGSMANDIYNKDGYRRNIRFERDVNPVGMAMSPYNPERWDEYAWGASNYAQPGDYYNAQETQRREDYGTARNRFRDREVAGMGTAQQIMDRIRRRVSRYRSR